MELKSGIFGRQKINLFMVVVVWKECSGTVCVAEERESETREKAYVVLYDKDMIRRYCSDWVIS